MCGCDSYEPLVMLHCKAFKESSCIERSNCSTVIRVRTDRGNVWKVLEFNVDIFKALKNLENDHRYGKVWKNP